MLHTMIATLLLSFIVIAKPLAGDIVNQFALHWKDFYLEQTTGCYSRSAMVSAKCNDPLSPYDDKIWLQQLTSFMMHYNSRRYKNNQKVHEAQYKKIRSIRSLERLDSPQYIKQYFGKTINLKLLSPDLRLLYLSNLSISLDCERYAAAQHQYHVNFLASARGDVYFRMLPAYAYFALVSNPNSIVEIIVPSRDVFINENSDGLAFMLMTPDMNVCVREEQWQLIQPIRSRFTNKNISNPEKVKLVPHSLRMLEVPVVKADYVYLSDVDILLTESVVNSERLAQMQRHNLPYSNILRQNSSVPRLTGVFLARMEEFYSPAFRLQQHDAIYGLNGFESKMNDENILAVMCNRSHGLPGPDTYRPLHGVHLSYNRRTLTSSFNIPVTPNVWCPLMQANRSGTFLCVAQWQMTTLKELVNVGMVQTFERLVIDLLMS